MACLPVLFREGTHGKVPCCIFFVPSSLSDNLSDLFLAISNPSLVKGRLGGISDRGEGETNAQVPTTRNAMSSLHFS